MTFGQSCMVVGNAFNRLMATIFNELASIFNSIAKLFADNIKESQGGDDEKI